MRILILLGVMLFTTAHAEPLRICATVPDLGDLAREVGGDEVDVTTLAKGPEDPHFVEARPSFIKTLSRADLFIEVGMELEVGWAPVLLQNARNERILPGNNGFVDASTAITPMGVPEGIVDRSMGDIHAAGNPHYLLDPENGVKVAALIAERLAEARPEKAGYFKDRLDAFRTRADKATRELVGQLEPFAGTGFVSDHDMWPYFARRFGLKPVAFMEPKPGVPPSTRHLGTLVDLVKSSGIRLVVTSSYFDPRHARFVAERTGARTAELAHQCGARPGTEHYLDMITYNVQQVLIALREP